MYSRHPVCFHEVGGNRGNRGNRFQLFHPHSQALPGLKGIQSRWWCHLQTCQVLHGLQELKWSNATIKHDNWHVLSWLSWVHLYIILYNNMFAVLNYGGAVMSSNHASPSCHGFPIQSCASESLRSEAMGFGSDCLKIWRYQGSDYWWPLFSPQTAACNCVHLHCNSAIEAACDRSEISESVKSHASPRNPWIDNQMTNCSWAAGLAA